MIRRPPRSPLFPYTPLCRSLHGDWPTILAAQERFHRRGIGALQLVAGKDVRHADHRLAVVDEQELARREPGLVGRRIDRKSTRLNSSHANISYAVFCLKKKK